MVSSPLFEVFILLLILLSSIMTAAEPTDASESPVRLCGARARLGDTA